MVIVIIGILAVVALPKFTDLSSDAQQAGLTSVATNLQTAASSNYAARKANSANGVTIANCSDVASALQGGALPTNGSMIYSITSAAIAADATVTCTVQDNATSPHTRTFLAQGIP